MYLHKIDLVEGTSIWRCVYVLMSFFSIKRPAEKTHEKTQKVLANELRNISDKVAANMLHLDTLHGNVRYSRRDRNMLPTTTHILKS